MKRKMNAVIIASSVLLGVAAISTAAYFIMRQITKNSFKDGDGMVNDRCLSCTYHRGGGMERDSFSICLKEDSLDTITLEVVKCDGQGAVPTTENYTVSTDALEKIYNICNKYDVTKWGELPYSEMIALDAPTVSICIETVNTTVRFDSNKELPENAYGIFSEICSVLDECIEQAKSTEQPGAAE